MSGFHSFFKDLRTFYEKGGWVAAGLLTQQLTGRGSGPTFLSMRSKERGHLHGMLKTPALLGLAPWGSSSAVAVAGGLPLPLP